MKTTVKTTKTVVHPVTPRPTRTVADVMTHYPRTAHPGMSLDTVIQTLAKFHLSGLPVVNERSEVIGMVSEFDLMWQESGVTPPPYLLILDSVIYLKNPITHDRDLHKALGRTVEEVMSTHPITITADKTVADAARIMHDRHIHRIPVVDSNHKLVGIITQGDVIQAMAKEIVASSRDPG
jgi:CBS domain-containing protein